MKKSYECIALILHWWSVKFSNRDIKAIYLDNRFKNLLYYAIQYYDIETKIESTKIVEIDNKTGTIR